MRALLQRVSAASVSVAGEQIAAIERGLLVFVAVFREDGNAQAERLAERTLRARLFPDAADPVRRPMNLSVVDVAGAVLAVSQFTLAADTRRGNRPSFGPAAPPALAQPLYEHYVKALRAGGVAVAEGRFGADMAVALVNDGPVTILLES